MITSQLTIIQEANIERESSTISRNMGKIEENRITNEIGQTFRDLQKKEIIEEELKEKQLAKSKEHKNSQVNIQMIDLPKSK